MALHYGWSGGHRMLVEALPDGRRQIQLGHCSGSERAPGTGFETAEIWLARGDRGLNSVAVPFQRAIRDALPPARRPRRGRRATPVGGLVPILFNSHILQKYR